MDNCPDCGSAFIAPACVSCHAAQINVLESQLAALQAESKRLRDERTEADADAVLSRAARAEAEAKRDSWQGAYETGVALHDVKCAELRRVEAERDEHRLARGILAADMVSLAKGEPADTALAGAVEQRIAAIEDLAERAITALGNAMFDTRPLTAAERAQAELVVRAVEAKQSKA